MKNQRQKGNPVIAGLFAMATVVAAGFAFASSPTDLTAIVRTGGSDAVSHAIEGGTATSGYSLGAAFDGRYEEPTTQDSRRLLVDPTGMAKSQDNVVTLYYTIADSFCPDCEFTVSSFVFRRSVRSADFVRTPRNVSLEASADGTYWAPLAGTTTPLEFQAGDTNYEYEFRVPRACQRNYRRYRLKFSGRDAPGDRLCVSEIKFFGSFRQHLDLIWNGPSTGGTWDAASRNWLYNGIATNWIPGARAVINASGLSVNGTQVVCGMKFADVDNPTVSGGTFEFIPSATIDVGSATNVTIASDLSGAFTGEDAVGGCVLGERTSMTNLPRLSAAKPQEGESVIWWRNRNLGDVTRVVGGNIYFDAYKGQKSAQPLVWSEDRTTATCWLYYQHGSGQSGLSWVAVKLELKQVGTDIAARLIKGGYVWLQPDEYGDDGSKIDFDELAEFRTQNIKDDANDGKVGLKDILLESSCTPCVSIVNGLDGGISRCQDKLPRDANKQGVWTTVAEGVRLSEFQPGDADVYYNNSDVERGYPCYEIRTEDALSIQYHRMNQGGDALLGVKVEFRENEGCIQARHVYSKYQRGDHAYPGGCDFDAEGIVNSQFEVAFRTFSLSARTVNLSGDVDLKGDLFLYRTDVRFTGSSVGLPVSATVDGSLAFAPASGTQAIGVSAGSHILPAATFAGQASIAFAEGGSLAIGEVDLDAATSIGLPAGLGQTAFRIGESAVLSKAELKKFTIADSTRRAVQDANGYIRDAERGGLILLFR